MNRRAMRVVAMSVGSLALLYVGLCFVARAVYPRMLFPAPRVANVPASIRGKLLELPQTQGGITYALFYAAPRSERVVVMFHGNGSTMFDDASAAEGLVSRGASVMLVEYRGYGLSYGPTPTEAAMYDDAEAALAYLAANGFPAERVSIWGTSLGTGVAAEMTKRGHASRLVLVSPFTSIVDMGRRYAPFLPMDLVMTHRFDTLSKASAIRVPTLVVHGDADEIVPFAMGERVGAAIPGARFVRVVGGHHNDLFAISPALFDTVALALVPPL